MAVRPEHFTLQMVVWDLFTQGLFSPPAASESLFIPGEYHRSTLLKIEAILFWKWNDNRATAT
jgi:hypothetical protein